MSEQTANELAISSAVVTDCKESSAELGNKRALTAEEAKRIFDLSVEIVCITNLEGEVLLANPSYQRILGYSAEEAAQMPWTNLIHPDDRARAVKGLDGLATGLMVQPTSPSSELRFVTKDGSIKWIQWTAVPIVEENKMFAIGRDLTSQRIAEAQNKELAAIVQSSTEAIFSVDSQNLINSWNHGAARLYGYESLEIVGKNVSVLVPGHAHDELNGLLKECLKGEYLENVECIHLDKKGTPVEVAISMSPVQDEFGQTSRVSIIARNVSHQKAAQKRIAEFYSMVSHELRTPLASIRGVLGLIEGGLVDPASEEANDLIKIARGSCDRLVRLVNDILDMRKIESGNFELEFDYLNPSDLISIAVDSMSSLAQESNVTIETDINGEGQAYGDRDRLIQVLVNLISNAVKFSLPGSTVKLGVSRIDNSTFRFSVTDSGPGISDEDRSRLFQKFQQLDTGDARSKSGVGLGLAIAKSIIDRHGGRLDVDSQLGSGSTFWFEVPSRENSHKQG